MEQWHLSDGVLPVLNSVRDPAWKSYPEGHIHKWREPPVFRGNKSSPGHLGRPVALDAKEKARAVRTRARYQLNLVASDKVPLDRELEDVRRPECKEVAYPAKLPKAAVIVVFHNEAWSTLLRTVHSVINASPRELLSEIILVDDYSTYGKILVIEFNSQVILVSRCCPTKYSNFRGSSSCRPPPASASSFPSA